MNTFYFFIDVDELDAYSKSLKKISQNQGKRNDPSNKENKTGYYQLDLSDDENNNSHLQSMHQLRNKNFSPIQERVGTQLSLDTNYYHTKLGLNPNRTQQMQGQLLKNQDERITKVKQVDSPIEVKDSQKLKSRLTSNYVSKNPQSQQSYYSKPGGSMVSKYQQLTRTKQNLPSPIASKIQKIQDSKSSMYLNSDLEMSKDFSQGGFSDKSVTQCKDFKVAYQKLQDKFLKSATTLKSFKGPSATKLILNSQSMTQFVEKRDKSRQQKQNNNQTTDIYNRLYKEKDRYFELKKIGNNVKLDEDMTECTFSPNSGKKKKDKNRSFNQLYQDILKSQHKSMLNLEKLRKERIEKEIRNFSQERSKSNDKSAMSPSKLSQKLYEKGLEKLNEKKQLANTKDMSRIDKNYTFKPILGEKTNNYAYQKNPNRKGQNVNEALYQDGLKFYKAQMTPKARPDFESPRTNEKSKKYFEKHLDKTIMEGLGKLEFNELNGLTVFDLFDLMRILKYASNDDRQKVSEAFKLISNGAYLGFDEIKTIVCGIEGLYIESFMKDMQIMIPNKKLGASTVYQLDTEENFERMMAQLRHFKINKFQFEYQHKLSEKKQQQLSPVGQFRPTLSKKSVLIEKKKEKSLGGSQERSRSLMERGRQYEKTKLKKIEEKLERELANCTFRPQTINYSFQDPNILSRHNPDDKYKKQFLNVIHKIGLREGEKRDKTTEEVQFEKQKQQCTFKPSINKPRQSKHRQQPRYLESRTQQKSRESSASPQKQQSQRNVTPFSLDKSKIDSPVQLSGRCSIDNISEQRRREIIKRNLIHPSLEDSGQGPIQISQPPLLYLEVNISEGLQARLMVFDNDNHEEVVEVFSDYYSIGGAKKTRLQEIVKMQLAKILQNIGEAVDEEEESHMDIKNS
ncbi:UNKNOWN [Stylonychia lemnae]|uniref:Uncharacterized protein n=1 Tax=Stylonychia lemnae TaxID=5949 RepID=A0A078AW83_STYLE|nr:UNKNOWN [Stylonychia lemnae]|eukprot:CDW86394.1 UNKNOWN [Stylonychia lemnae]